MLQQNVHGQLAHHSPASWRQDIHREGQDLQQCLGTLDDVLEELRMYTGQSVHSTRKVRRQLHDTHGNRQSCSGLQV